LQCYSLIAICDHFNASKIFYNTITLRVPIVTKSTSHGFYIIYHLVLPLQSKRHIVDSFTYFYCYHGVFPYDIAKRIAPRHKPLDAECVGLIYAILGTNDVYE